MKRFRAFAARPFPALLWPDAACVAESPFQWEAAVESRATELIPDLLPDHSQYGAQLRFQVHSFVPKKLRSAHWHHNRQVAAELEGVQLWMPLALFFGA